jgi:ATP-dependent Clp protease ATP-binding subunit ClpA
MEESLRVAVRRGDGHLGVEHLLLSLVAAADGGVTQLLAGLGVERRAVEERLEEVLGTAA